ncbi:hypothetical protein GA0115246_106052 [Streptomyces sp. SolWspMP-sol7th]|nr:hypothetical protein GA0115246_106052 [Streptomyces sp. SolWspMP-sol7th]
MPSLRRAGPGRGVDTVAMSHDERDRDRLERHEAETLGAALAAERRRARRALAARARDADDLARLLDALGLRPEEGRREPE